MTLDSIKQRPQTRRMRRRPIVKTTAEKYLTALAAAAELGISKQAVSDAVKRGALAGQHVGRTLLIPLAALRRYQKQRLTQTRRRA